MKIVVKDLQKAKAFELQAGGQRLKMIKQSSFSTQINGLATMVTHLEVTSALETITIVIPMVGHWKIEGGTCLKFFPRKGTCAEFKILIIQ